MRGNREPGATHVERALHLPGTTWILLAVGCALLLAVQLVVAQSGGGYDLSWWTVDGGGGTMGGGGPPGAYSLAGTIAQPDAGSLAGDWHRLKPAPDTQNPLKRVAIPTNALQRVLGISRRIHSAAE